MKNYSLCGSDWRLTYVKNDVFVKDGEVSTLAGLLSRGYGDVSATVPGNLEIDLYRAGVIEDPFYGDNHTKRDCEYLHSFYYKSFTWHSEELGKPTLMLEGLDTVAEIYLNDCLIGETDNMLIPHEIDLSGVIREGENTLLVHIRPVVIEARKYPFSLSDDAFRYNRESLYIRKAPHMFGWDIAPRIVSAGIWRPVYIFEKPYERISEFAIYTADLSLDHSSAELWFMCNTEIERDECMDYSLTLEGVCSDSRFFYETRLYHTSLTDKIHLPSPKLWWPRGSGEQNLYNVKVSLHYKGRIINTYETRLGVRTVTLDRTSTVKADGEGRFSFVINGKPIFAMGTNWVPVDALHSRDRERLPKILPMLTDLGCNIVRLWGGNVYEDDLFYDFCDERGIMLWQDFIMGCAVYPQDDAFADKLYSEVVTVVKRLRHHPSIVLWAGDNENDIAMGWSGQAKRDPNSNRLTREVIPKALHLHDYTRPYLPSSPYIDSYAYESGEPTSEDHLWGPRDYFKGDFYSGAVCKFTSETGYHGCPEPQSLRKFIPEEYIFTAENSKDYRGIENPMWIYHATAHETDITAPYVYRVRLMTDQVSTLFGDSVPCDIENFSRASQISQAEADKYFIERCRIKKGDMGGIIWWNLIDGWPQLSDAIVDYYGKRKLAYGYVKCSQQPLCLMFDEPRGGNLGLFAVSELDRDIPLTYEVWDIAKDELLLRDTACAFGDSSTLIDALDVSEYGDATAYLLIKWKRQGEEEEYKNHYVLNIKGSDYREYVDRILSVK